MRVLRGSIGTCPGRSLPLRGEGKNIAEAAIAPSCRSAGLPPVPKPVCEAPNRADPGGMGRFQPPGLVRGAIPAESPARRDWPDSAPRRGILIDVAAPGG